MLYRPEAFEPLVDTPWSELRARAAIRSIVEDADAAFRGPRLFWRANEWDGWHGTSPMKNLYVGTAGVLWALDRLRRRGYTETKLDLASLAQRNVELFRERPDYMKGMKLPALRDSALLTGRREFFSSPGACPRAGSSRTNFSNACGPTSTTRPTR